MSVESIGPGGATLHEVGSADSSLLKIACNLFSAIFPEEKRYLPYVRACAQGNHPSHPQTYDHIWLVQQNGEWVGVQIFSCVKTRSFGHVAYLGFLPHARGHGLGTWLTERTLIQLDAEARQFGWDGTTGYLVEVERPMDAKTEAEYSASEKRMKFYRQCNGIILPIPFMEPVMIDGVDYISPAELQNEFPRPMHLVLIPSVLGASLPNLNLVDFVHGLYLDVYRLSMEHIFVRDSLSYLLGV